MGRESFDQNGGDLSPLGHRDCRQRRNGAGRWEVRKGEGERIERGLGEREEEE